MMSTSQSRLQENAGELTFETQIRRRRNLGIDGELDSTRTVRVSREVGIGESDSWRQLVECVESV